MHTNEAIFYVLILSWIILRHYWFHLKTKTNNNETAIALPIYNKYDLILNNNLPYYSKLSIQGKNKFISRLIIVLEKTPIQGKDDFILTDEIKALIAGCIVQITFGFKQPNLPFLKGIGVYPDIFYSKLLRANVKGVVLGNGLVFISYQHFIDGYKEGEDTYNLGLHEFAHILQLQAEELSLFDERLSSYFSEWKKVGHPIFSSMRANNDHFFRDYASTNHAEFFSVCIENFFEIPAAFEKEFPDLFYHLCYLLKQNPLNNHQDYVFNQEHINWVNKNKQIALPYFALWKSQQELFFWHYFGTFVGLFAALAACMFVAISNDNQLICLRLTGISLLLLITIRLSIYKNIHAVWNQAFLKHFIYRIIPLLAFISIAYELIFIQVHTV